MLGSLKSDTQRKEATPCPPGGAEPKRPAHIFSFNMNVLWTKMYVSVVHIFISFYETQWIIVEVVHIETVNKNFVLPKPSFLRNPPAGTSVLVSRLTKSLILISSEGETHADFLCSPHFQPPPWQGYYLPCDVLETSVVRQISVRCWSRLKYCSPPPTSPISPCMSTTRSSSFPLWFPSLPSSFRSFQIKDISQLCEISNESPSANIRHRLLQIIYFSSNLIFIH